MRTSEKMTQQGNWLFRYRSFLPLAILIPGIAAMWFQREVYRVESLWFNLVCYTIALIGLTIRVIAVGYAADLTSGRNTKQQVAHEINHTGIYSLIRHPLYVGNFLIWFGLALYTRFYWLTALFVLVYWLYYERIILAEEDYLIGKFGEQYQNYAARVSGLLPRFSSYVPNKYRFRIKKVLRQEYSSVYSIVIVFLLLELAQDYIAVLRLDLQLDWIIAAITGTLVFITLRGLRKNTGILRNDPMRQKN